MRDSIICEMKHRMTLLRLPIEPWVQTAADQIGRSHRCYSPVGPEAPVFEEQPRAPVSTVGGCSTRLQVAC